MSAGSHAPDTDKDRKCFAPNTLWGYCTDKFRPNFPKFHYCPETMFIVCLSDGGGSGKKPYLCLIHHGKGLEMIQIDDKIISLELFTARFCWGRVEGSAVWRAMRGRRSMKKRSRCWKMNGNVMRRT